MKAIEKKKRKGKKQCHWAPVSCWFPVTSHTISFNEIEYFLIYKLDRKEAKNPLIILQIIILQTFHKLQHNLNNCGFVYISVTYYMGNKAKIC